MLRFPLPIALILATAGLLPAAPLSPEAKEPYQWRILLRTSQHPFLDEPFRERLSRELKAALSPTLGALGGVEIVDLAAVANPDALGKEFKARGFAALEPTGERRLDGVKHHGLNIEFKDGAFHLSSRQYDGFTGLISPVLRSRVVRTADQVARIAALILEPDFGAVATVETILNDDKHVKLVFRSRDLAAVDSLVAKGDVFAVAVIKEAKPAGLVSTPVQYTLLRAVEPASEGVCKCVILSRWASPFTREARFAAGKRAMRLPTLNQTIRVQLVDRAGKPHASGSRLVINASDIDFISKAGTGDGFEWRDGLYRSLRPYAGIACISVGVGLDRPQLFPVAVLTDDVLTLAFDIDPAAERRAEFIRDCTDLRFRIADLFTSQYANTAALNKHIVSGQNREALTRAEAGRETLATGEKALSDELKLLQSNAGAVDPAAKEILDACDRQLLTVRDGHTQLVTTIDSLKDALSKAGSNENIEKDARGLLLADRIGDLLKRGDIPDAIAAYDQLVALFPAEQRYKDEREKLKADWAPRDDGHRVARDCLRTLAAAKSKEDFAAVIEAIRKAIPVFKQKKDKLGLRKLMNTYEPALVAFRELVSNHDRHPESEAKLKAGEEFRELQVNLEQMQILTRETIRELTAEKK